MITTIILIALGFAAFFATGIDDTVAYAGSYLKNKKKSYKALISLGILLGTLIALVISIFAGALMEKYIVVNGKPIGHIVGGVVLTTLGVVMFTRGAWARSKKKKHLTKIEQQKKKPKKNKFHGVKFLGLGMLLFFATGIDDIIAYSNLIMAKGSWWEICLGVVIATFVSLFIAHILSDKLKKLPHPEKIGAGIIIIIGILLALGVL